MKASKKAFVHHESLAYVPAFSNKTKKKKKEAPSYLPGPLLSVKATHFILTAFACDEQSRSSLGAHSPD